MNASRLITGMIMILLGAGLIAISFFATSFVLIYGIPIFVLGIFILFNRKEDKIEEIKSSGGKRNDHFHG